MEREITFIHAADLHLDSPFKGLMELPEELFEEIKDSTFQALHNLVEAAIEQQVDFVLITGDLFDNEKQSLKAQIRLKQAFERLQDYGISVFLSYGNHDFVKGNIHQVSYPENVHIFPDEKVRSFVFKKNGADLARIYGFSYVNRAVTENKTDDFIIEDKKIPFHIAMLHGSIQGNADHAPYAPFQISELSRKDFHYWALGHIHKRSVLKEDPFIVYSGNTQGRHRKETGEKGCYLVRLTSNNTELTFLPLHVIEFVPLEADVSGCQEIHEIEATLLEEMAKLPLGTRQLVDMTLTADHAKLRSWQTDGQLEEMIELINESLTAQQPWKFIFRVAIRIEERVELHETSYGEHFLGELMRRFEEGDGAAYLQELYQHRQARKYLEFPAEEEEQAWKAEARARLVEQLVKGGAK